MKKNQQSESASDPVKLINKLENFSQEQLKNLPIENKEALLRQVESYLEQGLTPMQKYYDQLVKQFTLPAKNILKYDQKFFYQQIDVIRKAQGQEIKIVKKEAEIAARKLIEMILANVKIAVKDQLNIILDQFEKLNRDLFKKTVQCDKYEKMMKTQQDLL